MNDIVKTQGSALALSEPELLAVLESSLYLGASPESIKLVIGYCKASNLDPMQKPVHIVPMWDGKAKCMRDVIMPGIGLYRTQAARGGNYAGVSEPEFGEDITETIEGVSITYPSWCKVIVKRRLQDGTLAEFAATERWKENYAVRGGKEKSIAPNAMWKKRPYGQIAKCAEAQALRKAFPEVGSQPTADEMEDKTYNGNVIDGDTGEILPEKPVELPKYTDEKFKENIAAWQSAINAGKATPERLIAMVSSRFTISAEQAKTIRALKKEIAPAGEFVDDMEAEELKQGAA